MAVTAKRTDDAREARRRADATIERLKEQIGVTQEYLANCAAFGKLKSYPEWDNVVRVLRARINTLQRKSNDTDPFSNPVDDLILKIQIRTIRAFIDDIEERGTKKTQNKVIARINRLGRRLVKIHNWRELLPGGDNG